jgi:hypothetical protein
MITAPIKNNLRGKLVSAYGILHGQPAAQLVVVNIGTYYPIAVMWIQKLEPPADVNRES